MAEGYTAQQLDSRTLGTLLARLIDDLNKPDLRPQALNYVQDAIRHYQSQPWLFNEQDNSATAIWLPNTIYPQGSVIQASIGGTLYAICALNTGASNGTVPSFPSTIFTPPSSPALPPPILGTPGTVVDASITWANVGLWSSTLWTQLSTVYNINTYQMPVGYQTPATVEVTTANLRRGPLSGFRMESYDVLRGYDVIQPAPITAYPTLWAWYQQKLYIWPYPNGFFPITVSFRFGPPMISQEPDANFWTQDAEMMVRAWAAAMMSMALIHDPEAHDHYMAIAQTEERRLRSKAIQQRNPSSAGIPASDW